MKMIRKVICIPKSESWSLSMYYSYFWSIGLSRSRSWSSFWPESYWRL